MNRLFTLQINQPHKNELLYIEFNIIFKLKVLYGIREALILFNLLYFQTKTIFLTEKVQIFDQEIVSSKR